MVSGKKHALFSAAYLSTRERCASWMQCRQMSASGSQGWKVRRNSSLQWTVSRELTFRGIGLHSGMPCEMTICPAPADHGITFQRGDAPLVQACWKNVIDTTLSTVLGGTPPTMLGRIGQKAGYLLTKFGATSAGQRLAGTTVSTVEHLMAALSGAAISNANIKLSADEVPIMDGSCRDFAECFAMPSVLRAIPHSRARHVLLRRQVSVAAGGRLVVLTPWSDADQEQQHERQKHLLIEVHVDYGCNMSSGAQTFAMERSELQTKAANARTFCFHADIASMQRRGLARGGSLDNAVVYKDGAVLNAGGLRHADEPVHTLTPDEAARHKALDALGDLALAGSLVGRYEGIKPGHALNHALLRKLFSSPQNYLVL